MVAARGCARMLPLTTDQGVRENPWACGVSALRGEFVREKKEKKGLRVRVCSLTLVCMVASIYYGSLNLGPPW